MCFILFTNFAIKIPYFQMEAKHQLTQVVQGLTQFSLLLQACPAPGDFSATSNPSPFTPEDLPQMAYLQLGNNLWSKCFDSIKVRRKYP